MISSRVSASTLGGKAIFPFAATMAIGIVAGTFSSIYIASPVMMLISQRTTAAKGAGPKAAGKAPKRSKARA